MKYSQFEIDIFDEDKDKSHKSSLLGSHVGLEKFLVNYEPSSIPTVEVNLSTKNYKDYNNLKNIFVYIRTKNNEIKYNVGILDIVYKENLLILYGFLCKYDDFSLINSAYLGESYLKCIKSLDNRKLRTTSQTGEDIEFKDDFTFDYWKIQESNVQALHKILQLASKESIYSMDNDNIYINKIDYSNSKANYKALPPKEILYISKSDRIKDLISLDNKENNSLVFNNDEKSNFSINTSMGKFLIGIKNDTALINHIYSLPYITFLGDYLIKVLYDQTYVPFHIGNSMKALETDYGTTSNWYIISKVEKFSANGIQIAVLFSCK